MLALCVLRFVFGERCGDVGRMGERGCRGTGGSKAGRPGCSPTLWTFFGTWSCCGGLNIVSLPPSFSTSFSLQNTYPVISSLPAKALRAGGPSVSLSSSTPHAATGLGVGLLLKWTELSWTVESPFGKSRRGRAERFRQAPLSWRSAVPGEDASETIWSENFVFQSWFALWPNNHFTCRINL